MNLLSAKIYNLSDFRKVPVKSDNKVEISPYLERLRKDLSEEDYLEFLEAALCKDAYMSVEDEIKDLVDYYYG